LFNYLNQYDVSTNAVIIWKIADHSRLQKFKSEGV